MLLNKISLKSTFGAQVAFQKAAKKRYKIIMTEKLMVALLYQGPNLQLEPIKVEI